MGNIVMSPNTTLKRVYNNSSHTYKNLANQLISAKLSEENSMDGLNCVSPNLQIFSTVEGIYLKINYILFPVKQYQLNSFT